MHKKIFKPVLIFFICALVFCVCAPESVLAAENYTSITPITQNEDTGYEVYLDDWADLLSDTEEQQLLQTMEPISQYGNVAFVSILENPVYNTANYAEQYYYDHFSSNASGVLFLVDMQERYLWIYSHGEIYNTITTAYANTITDNVYTYASRGDYLTCASKAFEQIHSLLEDRPIAQPMKYISNALLAIVIALLLNYFLVMLLSRSRKASAQQLMGSIYTKVKINNPTTQFVHQTRTYSPRSSGGGGRGGHGGHGGHGGGGHGGGGSRGGGGGHRF